MEKLDPKNPVHWAKLKKDFDQLKTYKDKIDFWEIHGLYDPTDPTRTLYDNPKVEGEALFNPKNFFSINPTDVKELGDPFFDNVRPESETYQFIHYIISKLKAQYPEITFKNLKQNFDVRLADSPSPDVLIENRLSSINEDIKNDAVKWGYDFRMLGARIEMAPENFLYYLLLNGDFLEMRLIDVIYGSELADFEGFIRNHKRKIDKEENPIENAIPYSELESEIKKMMNEIIREIGTIKSFIDPKQQFQHEIKTLNVDRLKASLTEYGFFKLNLITVLPIESKETIIGFLIENDLPYQIAMLDFLGFVEYLNEKYCDTKSALYKCLAEVLNTTERSIKGNINVLNEHSKESKKRYTSHLFKGAVKKDYEKIK